MSSSTLTTIETQLNLYLISSAVMNIAYLTFGGFTQTFPIYYGDGTIRAIIFCKIYNYIIDVLGAMPKTMIIFACIDRFLSTSDRARFRALSTPKRAKYFIFFCFIFFSLCGIHVPIMSTVVYGQCTTTGVYSTIYSVYVIMFVNLIPSVISAVFGYLTYRNMRQMQMRVQPVIQNTTNVNIVIQQRDRTLLIIVISEIFVYLVTTALFPLILLELTISQYVLPNKSFQYLQIEIFIIDIAIFLLYINSGAAFYTYFIASKSFRRDVKQLILNTYWKITRQTPVENVSRTNRTLTQRETR